jgi:hypothetical protein
MSQITLGQLPPLPPLGPEIPKVVLVAGQTGRFTLAEEERHEDDPSMTMFLQPAKTVKALAENVAHAPNSFDFLVWIMPCAILHQRALPSFLETIHLLLERRYSIHMNKVHLPSYGLPHDMTYIVLLASPVCSAARSAWSELTQKTINEVIGDLSFKNTRIDSNNRERAGSFMCMQPPSANPTSSESNNGPTSTVIYNHNTRQSLPQGAQQIDFNSMTLKGIANGPFGTLDLQHPSKSSSCIKYSF